MSRYDQISKPLGSDGQPHWLARFDLANWGVETIAFVKPVATEHGPAYGIFAADGTELAVVDDHMEAVMTVRQNDLEVASVH